MTLGQIGNASPVVPPIGGPSERSVKAPVPHTPPARDKYAIHHAPLKEEKQSLFACCAMTRSKAENPYGPSENRKL